ncbi:MAG: LamG domain-containing protein [Verrucomicrobiaceae bacterium]
MKKQLLIPAFLVAASLSANAAGIHAGLLNYWPLDGDATDTAGSYAESTGVTADNGTVNGSVSFSAGLLGSAGNFPGGAGNNITVPDGGASGAGGVANDVDRFGSDMTLSVWVQGSSYTVGWQGIVAHGEGSDYRLARQGTSDPVKFAGVAGVPDIVTTNTYGPASGSGIWHNIVLSAVHGGDANFYVDGLLEGTASGVNIGQSGDNTNMLMIGGNPDRAGREFHGLIDDVAIWDRALSASEVGLIFASGSNGVALGAIPEPSSICLALLGGLGLLRRRR